ncbi:MAG: hypothetical protein RLZZ184_2575 [Cyanobacteriota bacterium]|jgi:hypothetical protein
MSRPNEDRIKIQCRLPRDKKAAWDKLLIEAGFSFRHKENIFPMYGEFLEALLDADPRALSIILKIFSKIVQKPLDKLE